MELFSAWAVQQGMETKRTIPRRGFRTAIFAAAIAACGLFPPQHAIAKETPVATTSSAPAPAPNTDVPVKKVVLFSSGVGYFQHAGTVDGNAVAQLQFDTAQINDVLKSLVLEDIGGSVSAVTYASQDPLAKQLQSFGVDITNDPSLDQLLNQLRGTQVTITLPGEQISGTILGVEKRTKPAGGPGENQSIEVPVINVVTDAGIRAIELPDAREVKLDDPVLQSELTRALAAVAGARNQDKKPVTIHLNGSGRRNVLLGYVVETPVWRTSYRLVLGDGDEANLQGWALVDNQTDNDWNDVELSLVSGRPISFIEDLYQPLYITRPTVQPQGDAEVTPPTYPEGMNQNQVALGAMARSMADSVSAAAPESSGPAGAPDTPLNPTQSIASLASAAKVGELFQYTIGNVSLPRQSSAMIPIVADPVKIERLSIFSPAVLPRNPLNGARLTNTTAKHLLGGPLTVFDAGGYAGDAQIDDTPPGQDRLISFGIDQQMLIDMTTPDNSDETVTGKIVNGVLEVTHEYLATTVYVTKNQSDHDKRLLIEQPIKPGWDLVDSPDPVERTDQLYRFEKKITAGDSKTITIKERHVEDQTFAILSADVDDIVDFTHNGSIPQDVKDALNKAADMKHSLADLQNRLQADQQKEQAIVQDQTRIDDTLRTVDRTTTIYSRLLQKLDDQETQLEKLRTDEDTLNQQSATIQKQLEDYLGSLSIGG
jgi:hypothetical protein